jgi:hypothetical protein
MAKIKETYLVLCISATMLYQFVGTSSLEYALKSYAQDPKKLQSHSIVISEKPQKQQEKKFEYRSTSDAAQQVQLSDPVKLQFFYDNN